MGIVRDSIQGKRGAISVQASSTHYCSPRTDGMNLWQYKTVEVAVFDKRGSMVRPSALLPRWKRSMRFLPSVKAARSMDDLFEQGNCPVAGYVSWPDVARIARVAGADVTDQDVLNS